jgi:hypothetical protein
MICYIFPSRSRPKKFFDCLDTIKILSESDNYFVIAKLDEDDESMDNPEVIERIKNEYPEVIIRWGISSNKIHAINRDMKNLPPCDIIVLQSDDMVWNVYGFDAEIREAFKAHSPNFDKAIHFPEEKSGNRTMVLTIMGINLYKQLGYLYYPEYESVYCDNDLTEMTRKMHKYVFVNKKLYAHNHPIWGLAQWDALYRHTERPEAYAKDKAVFEKRKKENFGINE